MKYIIVAYDRNRAIGAGGKLPWEGEMKSDMQRLKRLTTGNAIIMGRKTFESIGFALPNRQNIVVTSSQLAINGITTARCIDEAYEAVEDGKDAYIFGGGQIYASALATVDEIRATEIDTVIENADAFFPALDESWQEMSREHHEADEKNRYSFDFVTFSQK